MKKIIGILVTALFFTFFLFLNTKDASADTYDITQYFPLVNTDTWTYSDSSTGYINGTRTLLGTTTMRAQSSDGSTEMYLVNNSTGFKMYGMAGYDPYGNWTEFLYNAPLLVAPRYVEIGMTYNSGQVSFSYAGYTFYISSALKVEVVEDVVTDSGVVFKNTVKVVWTLTMTDPFGNSTSSTQQLWLSKNLGIVKDYHISNTGAPVTSFIKSGITHYSSGRKKAELLPAVDASGCVYYEYLDENYGGTGYGRVAKRQRLDGSYDLITQYWGSTNSIQFLERYNVTGTLTAKEGYNSNGSLQFALEYYASGNLKTYNDGGGNIYTFEDLNYYNVTGAHGQGRLIRWDYQDGNFNTFEYYSDTLDLSKMTRPVWQNGNIVPGSTNEERYYNEDFISNPRNATDSAGNTVVSTLILDDNGNPKAYIIKYDSSGSILWRKEFDTNITNFNVVVTVDKNDNVYVAAAKWNGSDSDVIIYGYTADGQLIGSYQYNGGSEEQITSILTGPSGEIYIAGERYQVPNYDARDLFITRLNSDMTGVLWDGIYDSGGRDSGGYLTIDDSGRIVLHGRCNTFSYEYYRVEYDANGAASPVAYDEEEIGSGSAWLGAWQTGREYQYKETIGSGDETYTTYAYVMGTGKTLIGYETQLEGFPPEFGGATIFTFINTANEDTGYRAEFDNGVVMEAVPDGDDGWVPTKMENYSWEGHIGSTWWLLWDTNIAIEKTSGGEYLAYSFDPNVENFDEWKQSLTVTALPVPLPALPELGDWWEWCFDNYIVPEFPPLSSEYGGYDGTFYRYDYNDYNGGTTTEYDVYIDRPGEGMAWIDIYIYDDIETFYNIIFSAAFDYNGKPDPDYLDEWTFLYSINYDIFGREIRRLFANGDFILIRYYDSGNKYVEDYINAQGAWYKSIVYYDVNPSVMFQQYLADPNPGTPGDVVFYEYDSQGRMFIKRFDNNGFIVTLYWDAPSNNKKHEIYFGAGNVWQKAFEYYDVDTPVIHYQWAADTEIPDEITFEEYNNSGQILRRNYDDGRIDVHEYYDSGNKHFDVFFNSGVWLKSIEYFDSSDSIIYRQWMVDTDLPDEVIFEEYNTDGKIVRRAFDTGDGMSTTYWDSGNKKIESYGTSSGEWKKSIEYYDDTLGGIHYQWFENTDLPDEIIFEERNQTNQIIRKQFDTGQTITTEYWDSGNKKLDAFSDANGIWQKGIEYWDTPSATMHYQWVTDPDPDMPGDLVFYEYDANGNLIGGSYDTGEPWPPEGGAQSVQTLDTEALARMELQTKQAQSSGIGNITFTSEMAGQPKTQELLTL